MKPRRIHYFQHVPFEGLGCIEAWANEKDYMLTATKFYEAVQLPRLENIDWLIIMGGPMSVHDKATHPWLQAEKAFIKQAIDAGKTVIGICLGAQAIAEVLGANVYPNTCKEIGWFDVTKTKTESFLLQHLPQTFPVFHWHGETFDLPEGAQHLLQSEACVNQAFLYKDNVLGLQFHFETTLESVTQMIKHERHELVPDTYVQSEATILAQAHLITENNRQLYGLLKNLEQQQVLQA